VQCAVEVTLICDITLDVEYMVRPINRPYSILYLLANPMWGADKIPPDTVLTETSKNEHFFIKFEKKGA